MTVEEVEKQARAAEVKHPPIKRLHAAADEHFGSVEYVDARPGHMKRTQAEAEKLDE